MMYVCDLHAVEHSAGAQSPTWGGRDGALPMLSAAMPRLLAASSDARL